MKKVILACAVLCGTATLSLAQQAQTPSPAAQQATPDNNFLLFSSKISEIDANLQRNNTAQAQKSVTEVMAMMQGQIDKNTQLLKSTKDASQKKVLASRVQRQTEVAGQMKGLSTDVAKNKMEILGNIKAFMQVL